MQQGWYNDNTRYGNQIHVKWNVEGDPNYCSYYQDERKTSETTTDLITGHTTTQGGILNRVKQSYTDYLGQQFGPAMLGPWLIEMNFDVTYTCISSPTYLGTISRRDIFTFLKHVNFPPH